MSIPIAMTEVSDVPSAAVAGPSDEHMDFDERDEKVEHADDPCIWYACFACQCALLAPCVVCNSYVEIKEKTQMVLYHNGKYDRTIKTAGYQWVNSLWYNQRITIPTARLSFNMPAVKMVDMTGTPLLVSGVVSYEVTQAYLASNRVSDYYKYLNDQASSVLKTVVSRFPYDSDTTGDGKRDVDMCLKNEGTEVASQLVVELQKQVSFCGLKIHSFRFDELSYAPEIAGSMLKRQQAQALVSARKKLVEGAVDTAAGALERMKMRGIKISDEAASRLVVNMLTVMVSDTDATPTISV